MSASTDPAATRPASTVVPLRDSPRGLEVLVTVRPEALSFMGGATVFPGGAVAEADSDPAWEEASTLSGHEAATLLGEADEPVALAAYVCAMREAFEEVGLIVADGAVERLTRAVADNPAGFLRACLDLGVRLATDRLHPAGRFVTPLGSPVRFDARFFVIIVPEGWEPAPHPEEVADCRWVTAEEALDDFAAGRAVMAPPTVEMLQILRPHGNAGAAIEAVTRTQVGDGGFIFRAPVAPLTEVVLAPNPGVMTGPGTNTYVVGSGPRAIVDPAVADPEFIDAVLDAAGEVAMILITHRHEDHVGGVQELVRCTGAEVRAFSSDPAGGAAVTPIADGERIEIPGATLTALHTPGHAPDHLCFVMDGWLFAGDNVLGEGTSVIAPPEGSMSDYLSSLERMRELPVEHVLTGHFRPLDDAPGVLSRYISHRREREAKIVEALEAGAGTMDEIVTAAYADTPVSLHPIAHLSALAHLQMLETEGRAEQLPGAWRLKVVE